MSKEHESADTSSESAETSPPIRIAVIEDHVLVRDSLSMVLTDAGFAVVYEGVSPAELLAGTQPVDVVLLDLELGEGRVAQPADAAAMIERGWRVIVVSAMGQPEQVREFLRTDVAGFVPKWEPHGTLVRAIRQVADGADLTSRELASILFSDDDPRRPALSEQEIAALRYYASGHKMSAVARRMNVSENTAKEYIRRVREKYTAAGRPAPTKTDLYRAAVRDHFLDE